MDPFESKKGRHSASFARRESGAQVVSGFGPVFAHFPGLDLTVAVLVRRPRNPQHRGQFGCEVG